MTSYPHGTPDCQPDLREVVGGRGERVRGRIDDIAPPVAIDVDGQRRKVEGIRNCVCPNAPAHEPLSVSAGNVTVVDDLDRRDQFGVENSSDVTAMHEGVASDWTSGRAPIFWPSYSTPQIAASM